MMMWSIPPYCKVNAKTQASFIISTHTVQSKALTFTFTFAFTFTSTNVEILSTGTGYYWYRVLREC